MDMVQHRGYFSPGSGCKEVANVLRRLRSTGIGRVVVGHTPHDDAHERCGGQLLATDSSLSRSFRAHGNLYCPLRDSLQAVTGLSMACKAVVKKECEGSISRLVRASPSNPWPTSVDHFKMHELRAASRPPVVVDRKVEL